MKKLIGYVLGGAVVLLIALLSFGILPATSLKLVEGYMPMQMLFELTASVAIFALMSRLLSMGGVNLPRFWQGILFWVYILLYLKFRVYPPIPFSATIDP